jgi:maltose alpha-D-glucosyltransferase/alpha-amylase
MHVALARTTGDAAFDPQPVAPADVDAWLQAARHAADGLATACAGRSDAAAVVDAARRHVEACIGRARGTDVSAWRKTRLHGDLHLAEVLVVQDDVVLIDFEGDGTLPLAQRRAKQLALRDLASLRCALDEAAHAALARVAHGPGAAERLAPAARRCAAVLRDAVWQAYGRAAVAGGLYADDAAFEATAAWCALFEAERACAQVRRALAQRPDALAARLAALADLTGRDPHPPP